MYFDNCKTVDDAAKKYRILKLLLASNAEITQEVEEAFKKKTSPTSHPSHQSHSNLSFAEKIEKLLAWSVDHPEFDPTFPSEIQKKLEKGFTMSDKQVAAIDNIIRKFKVPL